MARDDERTYLNAQAAMFSVAITLLGLLAAVASSACDFRSDQTQCFAVDRPVLAALPLLPLATMAYIQISSTLATLRSYYVRGLEREIRKLAGTPIAALSGMMSSSYVDFTTTLVSFRRGRKSLRMSALIILCVILVVFGGFTVMIATKVPPAYRVGMAVVYAPLVTLLFAETMASTAGGRSMFNNVLHRYLGEQSSDFAQQRTLRPGRSLTSYLIIPRPEEWQKWAFVPLAYVCGMGLGTTTQGEGGLWKLALAVLVVEYLVYQGRYQWNDIRGLSEDLVHPERAARGRLPTAVTGPLRAIKISLAVSCIRQLAAFLVCLVLILSGHGTLGWTLLGAISTVWVAATLYEALRTSPRAGTPRRMSRTTLCIIGTVGFGYAVRAFAGLSVAGLLVWAQPMTAVLIAAAWTYGIMFVTLTWTLEAMAHIVEINRRHYYLTSAMTVDRNLPSLERKPHIGQLLGLAGYEIQPLSFHTHAALTWCGRKTPLLTASGAWFAPWNVGFALSLPLAMVAIAALGQRSGWVIATSAAFSLIAAAILSMLRIGPMFIIMSIFTGLLAAALTGMYGTFVWIVFVGTYGLFRASSYHALKHPFERFSKVWSTLLNAVFRRIVGDRTLHLLEDRNG